VFSKWLLLSCGSGVSRRFHLVMFPTEELQVACSMLCAVKTHAPRPLPFVVPVALRNDAIELKLSTAVAYLATAAEFLS
jgi:hypothetical protein